MAKADQAIDYQPLRIFTFVAQTEVWLIWLIYSVVVFGLLSVPSVFLAIWWIIFGVPFLQFSLNLIESTARGIEKAPRMTAEGFKDGRIYKQLLLSSVWVSMVFAIPPEYQPLAIGFIMLVCPAMTAFIAMENSFLRAINPVPVASFIWHMGLSYILLRLVVTAVALYLLLVFQNQTSLLSNAAGRAFFSITTVYLLLVMSRSVGALIFSRRNELGIRTVASQEQAEADRDESIRRERQAFLEEMYQLANSGRAASAWDQIEKRLKRDRFESEGAYFVDLSAWEDRKLKHKLAQGYLKRLVKQAPELAWPILEEIHGETGGDYRLESGEAVLEFAGYATTSGQKRVAADLLQYFEEDFPNHPRIREALLVGADLACQLDDFALAKQLFDRVKKMRGLVHKPTFDRCLKLLSGSHE